MPDRDVFIARPRQGLRIWRRPRVGQLAAVVAVDAHEVCMSTVKAAVRAVDGTPARGKRL
jgi:hypothetical protein